MLMYCYALFCRIDNSSGRATTAETGHTLEKSFLLQAFLS
ncbi:hypothetical protein BH20VER3_BH20VER3_08560 [soil metagenome]